MPSKGFSGRSLIVENYESEFLQLIANHVSLISQINPRRESATEPRHQFDAPAPNMDVRSAASLICRDRSVLAEILGKINPGIPDGQEGLDGAPSA